MPRIRTQEEALDIFKDSFAQVKGDRKTGWGGKDSEALVLKLIENLPDSGNGKLTLGSSTLDRLRSTLQLTPDRVVAHIEELIEQSGGKLDSYTRAQIREVVDVAQFRVKLVKGKFLEAAPKTGKRSALADMLAQSAA